MRPLLVASIPHTGTMFTLDLLPGRRGVLPGRVNDDRKYWCHLHEPHAQEAMSQCFVIVPLRRYERVELTWIRHGMSTVRLKALWEDMRALEDVFFLPIDMPEREDRLAALSHALGVDIHTDWRPVNSTFVSFHT